MSAGAEGFGKPSEHRLTLCERWEHRLDAELERVPAWPFKEVTLGRLALNQPIGPDCTTAPLVSGLLPMATLTTLRSWLRDGPFDLALSSGFFGFYAHAGVLSVLEDEGLLPERLSGSSAGALVACAFASGLSSAELMGELRRVRREHFWDPGPGLGLLRGRRLRDRVASLLPVERFEQCQRPVRVSAYDVRGRCTRSLDTGALATAVHASCAVPGMFHPVWIDGRPHVDGGLADRPGFTGVPEGRRVFYHHLTSRLTRRRAMPTRANTQTLVIRQLPKVDPFRLERGIVAMNAARCAARDALDQPLHRDGLTTTGPI